MLSLILAAGLDLGAVAGPVVYGLSFGSDAYSTGKAWEACRTNQARCFEQNPGFNTGSAPGAILGTLAASWIDHEVYKRNKAAAWGGRAAVAVVYFFICRNNLRVARDVQR